LPLSCSSSLELYIKQVFQKSFLILLRV